MNAKELYDELVKLQDHQGVNLKDLTVVTKYHSYDPSVPYDVGCEEETYPDQVSRVRGELVLS